MSAVRVVMHVCSSSGGLWMGRKSPHEPTESPWFIAPVCWKEWKRGGSPPWEQVGSIWLSSCPWLPWGARSCQRLISSQEGPATMKNRAKVLLCHGLSKQVAYDTRPREHRLITCVLPFREHFQTFDSTCSANSPQEAHISFWYGKQSGFLHSTSASTIWLFPKTTC